MTLDKERQKLANLWAGKQCTLNGKRAKIVGGKLPFPKIVELDGGQLEAEFSWQAVDRIMKGSRAFVTNTNKQTKEENHFSDMKRRIAELVNMKTDEIRFIFADLNPNTDSVSKARTESQGWDKGSMVAEIIRCE